MIKRVARGDPTGVCNRKGITRLSLTVLANKLVVAQVDGREKRPSGLAVPWVSVQVAYLGSLASPLVSTIVRAPRIHHQLRSTRSERGDGAKRANGQRSAYAAVTPHSKLSSRMDLTTRNVTNGRGRFVTNHVAPRDARGSPVTLPGYTRGGHVARRVRGARSIEMRANPEALFSNLH